MAFPEPLPCSRGLEILQTTTHLFVRQFIGVTEVLRGFETKNKYEVINSKDERIFFAVEATNYCLICCYFRKNRPFNFKVIDLTGNTIMQIERPCSCTSYCGYHLCCCGLFEKRMVNVKLDDDDDETLLGQVSESCHMFSPRYVVKNEKLEPKLKITCPGWASCCKSTGNVEFQIKQLYGGKEHCGRISKEFDNLEFDRPTTVASDVDNYGVCFPLDMDVRMKATLLGAIFLINFKYFESSDEGSCSCSLGSASSCSCT